MNDKKKVLCIASMASNLDNFNRNNVRLLRKLGYEVTLASNFNTKEDTNSQQKIKSFVKEMQAEGIVIKQIDFSRHIGSIRRQLNSFKQVKELLSNRFDLIHCHTPICAAITRICAKKYRRSGTKVIYTAHGFHFYDGAPAKNWIVYYPIEKWLSKYTDALITINKEDYRRALGCLRAKKVVYIPGIGVDTGKYGKETCGKDIRKDIGIKDTDIVFLSVGELNDNKNHETVIKALGKLKKDTSLLKNIFYVIAGMGEKEVYLKKLIKEYDLLNEVKLIGYCSDMVDLYKAADVFVFPSYREGLSLSLMEAMASGLPVICSKIRGNVDLINQGKGGVFFNPYSVDDLVSAIKYLLKSDRKTMGKYNKNRIRKYDISQIDCYMKRIYESIDN